MKPFPCRYSPIHVRSCFSFGIGCLTPEKICSAARQRGYPAVGMVDSNNFYGLIRFLEAAEREGVKAVVGMILARKGRELATAYVLERRGFVRLCEIASARSSDLVDDLLCGGWPGLALLSEETTLLRILGRCSTSGLYVKLSYGRPLSALLRYARCSGLPVAAVNDACYLEEGQARTCNLLRAIHACCPLDELPAGRRVQGHDRLVRQPEMERYFSAVPEALENARLLAERADSSGILSKEWVFPSYDGLRLAEECRLLRSLRLRGSGQRYPQRPAPGRPEQPAPAAAAPQPGLRDQRCASAPGPAQAAWKRRLDHELEVIRKKRFAGYFLVVRDIVARCPRTCGRGSSAASIVSYLLGITHVDPLRYDLSFARFLNLQRSDPPDIDVDFPWDERDRVLRYVFSRYRGRCGMVAEQVTFGPRSSMREAAKAFGLPEKEIEKMVHFYRHGERSRIPDFLLQSCEAIRGLPRNLGTHCGGVVITPGPISRHTHVQSSPLGYPVIAWEKKGAEAARLVKIDLLGNRSLAVLRDTISLVNRASRESCRGGQSVPVGPEAERLTWEGSAALSSGETRDLIAAGDTLGIFYVESPATRQLLRKMGRGDYEHLIIASSIIRPAANRAIREFLSRLHGARYRPPTPVLADTLKDTYGVMVYQEDVSRVAAAVAGLPPGEADQVRKTLSRKNGSRALEALREHFFAGGAARGLSGAVLQRVWDMIVTFRGYSFCKAHSASYALVSYKLAYLKRFHPLEFFVSVINNGGGYYSRQTYLNECRRLGFRILLPDVNSSRMEYLAIAEHGDRRTVRIGLGQLRGIDRSFLLRVLAERDSRGCYRGYADFVNRINPGLTEVRILIRSGALDSLGQGLSRSQLLRAFFHLRAGQGQGAGQELFPGPREPEGAGDYPDSLKLLDEIRTLGLIASCHPVEIFRHRAQQLVEQAGFPPLIRSGQLALQVGRPLSLLGLLVTGKEVLTRCRERMVFVSFEDEESVFEAVLFPAVFRRYFRLIDGGGVFVLTGKVEEEWGALSLKLRHLSRLFRQADTA